MKKKIIKEVEDLLTGRERIKRTTAERMKRAESEAEQARREMEQATRTDDEAAFIKAADKERFNNSIIENCRQRLEQMESIPKEEAAAMLQQIQAAIDETEAAATRKAADSIKAFYTTAKAADAEIDELQALANRYANATGNADLVQPYIKRNSALLNLCYEVEARKRRTNATLYNGITN